MNITIIQLNIESEHIHHTYKFDNVRGTKTQSTASVIITHRQIQALQQQQKL